MTIVSHGNSFPIKTFYFNYNVFIVQENFIYCINPQGSKACFKPQDPIIDAAILGDGTIIIFDGSLYSLGLFDCTLSIKGRADLNDLDVLEISAKGQQIYATTCDGKLITFEYDSINFILKNVLRESTHIGPILVAGGLDKSHCFYYSSDLEDLHLTVCVKNESESWKRIDNIKLTGISNIQGHLEFDSEYCIEFVIFDGDTISKIIWNKASRSHTQNIFKINMRTPHNKISLITQGDNYTINDVMCPSFLIYTTFSEIFLGVLVEDVIKFWAVNSDVSVVESAVFCEEGRLFMNARERSGFYSFDPKNLKFYLNAQIENFSTFTNIQVSETLIGGDQSLICLSLSKDCIYSLNKGMMPKYKFISDPLFRGISKIWPIKTHFQSSFHEYVVFSSEYSTFIVHWEDYVMTDVTNIMNIDRDLATLTTFNLKNSGFVFHVSPKKIIAGDMSKIDSPDCQFVKYEYINENCKWDMSYVHDYHLFCLSRSSNCISVFQLKGRPRDTDLILLLTEIDVRSLGFVCEEISTFSAQYLEGNILIYLASVSGHLYYFYLDPSFQCLKKLSVNLGATIETIVPSNNDFTYEVYTGTRSGELALINFKTMIISQIDRLSHAPLKLSKLSNDTLMAFNFESSLLIAENSEKCTKRKIINWESESAAELICRTGESYITGIKDDSLFLMAMPPLSENVLSRRSLFHNAKIYSFLFFNSEVWILGCSNVNDRKNYVKLFDKSGLEMSSIEEGTDQILDILSVDEIRSIILVVLTARDGSQSKLQLFDTTSSKLEVINEYNCEGIIGKAKISDRIIFYSINEEFFALELCPYFSKFLNRTSYHFRNTILDFDILNNMALISCYSDGLDILSLNREASGLLRLAPSKGDIISRTCISCVWINPNTFIISDKRNTIQLCAIEDGIRWVKTVRSIKFNEIIIRIFKATEKIYCESISGMSTEIIMSGNSSYETITPSTYLSKYSFKKKIILRIVASVKHYLSVSDLERAEDGLISLLNLVGYISSDIIEVFFSYLRIKYPSNYNATAAYINNLRPRETQNFENLLLDYELLLCAFHEKNTSAVNQLLLRLDGSTMDIFTNTIRSICAVGIPNFLPPNSSYKSCLSSQFLSSYRMIAQLTINHDHISNRFTIEHHALVTRPHPDISVPPFSELDYNHLELYALLPNFLNNFENFVREILFNYNISLRDKIRYIGYLANVRVFFVENRQKINDIIKSCFDVLLYIRFSEENPVPESKNDDDLDQFDPTQIPIFHEPHTDLIKAIIFLMKI